MANPGAHFEIYDDNPTKLAGFYQSLFGWQINKAREWITGASASYRPTPKVRHL